MSNEQISEMLDKTDKQLVAFEKELIHMAWTMRGMSLNEAYSTSPSQRQHIAELFKDNLEITKTSGLPFF